MKTYITISALALSAIMTTSAQEAGASMSGSASTGGSVGATTSMQMHGGAMPPLMDIKAKYGEARKDIHGQVMQIRDDKKELMDERAGMRASNTEARVELRMETRGQMKNATSAEDRKGIMIDAKEKRDEMRASNTEERKEMSEKSKKLVGNRMSLIGQRLIAADEHLQSALLRINTYIDTYNASTTNSVKISKSSPLLAKLLVSGPASHSAALSVYAYASTTIDASNRNAFKSAVSAAEDALKTFQVDLKLATKDLIATYDLKANKK